MTRQFTQMHIKEFPDKISFPILKNVNLERILKNRGSQTHDGGLYIYLT